MQLYFCNLLAIFISLLALPQATSTLLHVPLDERFTTRVAFLNLAKFTPLTISTLPDPYLPSLKQYSQPSQIISWVRSEASECEGAIISLETIMYGSLIASRISNNTLTETKGYLSEFIDIAKRNPSCQLYASAVIMRIPEYNGDFEEPWFWQNYGALLYTYSFYSDKYSRTHDEQDYSRSQQARKQIPADVLQEFTWRRNRNHLILLSVLQTMAQDQSIFERLYITLDDNAQYGFNVAEADEIRRVVAEKGLANRVLVYPGADQVSFALLSRYSLDWAQLSSPQVRMIFRDEQNKDKIPNYEGLPMSETIKFQIQAAGGIPFQGTTSAPITLLINNFNDSKQIQAPDQSDKATKISYQSFTEHVRKEQNKVVGFIDNRFSNGADLDFADYVLEAVVSSWRYRQLDSWCYAGWNTNGNTVGTVVANSILLHVFNSKRRQEGISVKSCDVCSPCPSGDVQCANGYFNALRILEDREWQANMRQKMKNYIAEVFSDSFNNLGSDIQFYQRFALKPFESKFKQSLQESLALPFKITGAYFPWNRTFEIGIYGEMLPRYYMQ